MAFMITLVFLVSAFAASCSLDTSGTASASGDGARDDEAISESMDVDGPDVPPDLPDDVAPPDPPPDGTACTLGEESGGQFCCKKAEGTGWYDSLEECDCNGLEDMCTRQAKKCCNMGGGIKICKDDTTGCLCLSPEDADSCNGGQVCCGTSPSSYTCSSSPEGCLCDPGDSGVDVFCGSSRRCCMKPDDAARCHTDTSTCKCYNLAWDQYAECGETSHICCDRGEGELRCGATEIGCDCSGGDDICWGYKCCGRDDRFQCANDLNRCACETHADCGDGTTYLCCNKWWDGGWFNKECTNSACYCQCSDMSPHDCTYFGESYSCQFEYCAEFMGTC